MLRDERGGEQAIGRGNVKGESGDLALYLRGGGHVSSNFSLMRIFLVRLSWVVDRFLHFAFRPASHTHTCTHTHAHTRTCQWQTHMRSSAVVSSKRGETDLKMWSLQRCVVVTERLTSAAATLNRVLQRFLRMNHNSWPKISKTLPIVRTDPQPLEYWCLCWCFCALPEGITQWAALPSE